MDKKIKEARKVAGLTQEDLEAISGISQTLISKIESEKRCTSNQETAVALYAALGINEKEVGTLAQFLRSRENMGLTREELGMLIGMRASRPTWRNATQDAWVLALNAVKQALASK